MLSTTTANVDPRVVGHRKPVRVHLLHVPPGAPTWGSALVAASSCGELAVALARRADVDRRGRLARRLERRSSAPDASASGFGEGGGRRRRPRRRAPARRGAGWPPRWPSAALSDSSAPPKATCTPGSVRSSVMQVVDLRCGCATADGRRLACPPAWPRSSRRRARTSARCAGSPTIGASAVIVVLFCTAGGAGRAGVRRRRAVGPAAGEREREARAGGADHP